MQSAGWLQKTPSQAATQGLLQQSLLQCDSPETFYSEECALPRTRPFGNSFLRQELLQSFPMNSLEYTRLTLEVSAANYWNNADELSQVSSINCSEPYCCKLFIILYTETKYPGTLYRNVFLFLDWLSKSEVQLDLILI